jgi:hypothetical protein
VAPAARGRATTVLVGVVGNFEWLAACTPRLVMKRSWIRASMWMALLIGMSISRSGAARVAVRAGPGNHAELYTTENGQRFLPRGVNFIRLGLNIPGVDTPEPYHDLFCVGRYKRGTVGQPLQELRDSGYNVIRVFLTPACMTVDMPKWQLNATAVSNVTNFLWNARIRGLRVVLTIANSTWRRLPIANVCVVERLRRLHRTDVDGRAAQRARRRCRADDRLPSDRAHRSVPDRLTPVLLERRECILPVRDVGGLRSIDRIDHAAADRLAPRPRHAVRRLLSPVTGRRQCALDGFPGLPIMT